jgi:hypothetical protein
MKYQVGDIVTVHIQGNASTNTYVIQHVLGDWCVLNHPLNPEISLFRKACELNVAPVESSKSPTENSLWFLKNHLDKLDYDKRCELDALILHFIAYRNLSNTQKKALSNIGGYVAGILAQNDIDAMIRLVKENKSLLDSFNLMWYENYKEIFEGGKKISTKGQQHTIQNMAFFTLAQMNG